MKGFFTRRLSPLELLASVGVGFFLIACIVGMLETPFHLLVGWALYAARVLPRITVNWPSVLSALLWLALFTAGVHFLCRWLYREMTRLRRPNEPRPWRVRWTLGGVSVVVVTFAAGTAAVGIVHQVGFLRTTDPPMFASRGRFRFHEWDAEALKRFCEENWQTAGLADEKDWNADRVRHSNRMDSYRQDGAFDEHLHLLLLDGPDGRLGGMILFHRDPTKRERHGMAVATADGVRMERYKALPEWIARISSGTTSAAAGTASEPAGGPTIRAGTTQPTSAGSD